MLISAFVNLRVCDSECLSVPPGFVNLRGKQFVFQQIFHLGIPMVMRLLLRPVGVKRGCLRSHACKGGNSC